jgi:hypothetical protein
MRYYILFKNETEPESNIYMAVPEEIFVDLFEEPIGKLLIGYNVMEQKMG